MVEKRIISQLSQPPPASFKSKRPRQPLPVFEQRSVTQQRSLFGKSSVCQQRPVSQRSMPLNNTWDKDNSRPNTGQSFPERQSKNPFFIRNAPNPTKVRHIKGFLNVPVCTVLDAGYNENVPKKQQSKTNFLFSYPGEKKKEKFIPGVGIVNLEPSWVELLKEFTEKVKEKPTRTKSLPLRLQSINEEREIRISTTTPMPRLQVTLPPPVGETSPQRGIVSRQSSRASNHRSQSRSHLRSIEEEFVRQSCEQSKRADVNQNNIKNDFLNIQNISFEDNPAYVFYILSQVLQTDSIDDIGSWLLQAPGREKEIVLEMVRAVANTNRDFRQGMLELEKLKQPDYQQNFLYHENSLDIEEIKKHNSDTRNNSKFHSNNSIMDQLKETVECDIRHATRKSLRSGEEILKDVFPKITEEDAEIEGIRSRLASRSGSVNVFSKTR